MARPSELLGAGVPRARWNEPVGIGCVTPMLSSSHASETPARKVDCTFCAGTTARGLGSPACACSLAVDSPADRRHASDRIGWLLRGSVVRCLHALLSTYGVVRGRSAGPRWSARTGTPLPPVLRARLTLAFA
jgi:hypothetical protein